MHNHFDEITVRIRPLDATIAVEERIGDAVMYKNISHDDLMNCIKKSVKEAKTIRSGFLPENCISYDVSDNAKTVVVYAPPCRMDFTYHKTVYERFPLPAMAFKMSVDSFGRTSDHMLAVVADETPSPKTRVYKYPFSNVYETGLICTGAANSLPAYRDVRTLGTLPRLIMSFPNNDHMYSQNKNRQNLLYRDLLELLKDKEPSYYYEHILVPTGGTLQGFIDGRILREVFTHAA